MNLHDLRDYGAIGDGETLNTDAFRQGIQAASTQGGGTVYVPPGDYVTGTIKLESNVTLLLEAGACIYGSTAKQDYDKPALIYAKDAESIAVRGRGTLDGNGRSFFVRTESGWERGPFRPTTLMLIGCENVLLEGFTLKNSAAWAIHPIDCDRIAIRGITMRNGNYEIGGRNADGIDPDGCSNVTISDCYLETGDDAIVLKCTRHSRSGACSNITVTNCVLKSAETALKIGSETNGSFTSITFSNCAVVDSGCGIGLWMRDGGLIDGWVVDNVSMNVSPGFDRGGQAIYFWCYPRTEGTLCGTVRNVSISNVRARGDGGIFISGTPEQHLHAITLENIKVTMRGDVYKGWHQDPPYPFYVWGHHKAPYDIFCRYVDDLKLRDVEIEWNMPEEPEWGSAFRGIDIDGLILDGFRGRQALGSEKPAISLIGVSNAMIRNCIAPQRTGTFLGMGCGCSRATLTNNDLSQVERAFSLEDDDLAAEVYGSGNRLPD